MPARAILLRPLAGLAIVLVVASALLPDRPAATTDGPAGAASVAPVASSAAATSGSRSVTKARVVGDVRHDTSKRLASYPAVVTELDEEESEASDPDYAERRQIARRGPSAVTPNRTPLVAPGPAALAAAPAPIVSFDGVSNRNGVSPPDANGDIGKDHYVQWVNLSFAIFDRAGALLYGPANGNTFWKGFGGPCETRNDGDPIVQYDQLADRWMVAQFSLPGGAAGYHECIAVSATGDPLGAWHRYDFTTSTTLMNDYPKFGVWPDGYYMSVNQFAGGSTWAGAGAAVFERSAMLDGLPARMVYMDLYGTDANLGGMLPSDLDGQALPPAGAPNVFAQFDDDSFGYSADRLWLWAFGVDWSGAGSGTFTQIGTPGVAAFDSSLCSYSRSCMPQPGTATKVDTLSDRLMYRLAYRVINGTAYLVVNHAVDVNGADRAGIRWYQLSSTDGRTWGVRQQGDYSPDATNRWLGSIAMNGAGDIALAYSASSTSVYPSLRFTGRTADAALGSMTYAEGSITEGTGAITSKSSRFGDYASLSVDPNDDCTFWFTGEYAAVTGSTSWKTRIGAFRLAGCSTPTPTTGTISGTVVDRSTGAIVSNATIRVTGAGIDATTRTNAFGTYGFVRLPAGSYALTASASGYDPGVTDGIAVVAGTARTVVFRMQPKSSFSAISLAGSNGGSVAGFGDGNGYESGAANVGLTADGIVATDSNSGTASSTTCPTSARDAHDFGRGVTIPAGSLVKGISVSLVGRASVKTSTPRFCVLLSTDGKSWTAGRTSANLTTSTATFTLGASADTWGRSWTASDVATLGVRVIDLAGSTTVSFYLDAISVAVTYQ